MIETYFFHFCRKSFTFLKKIDSLLIRSFWPPFVGAFFISAFVLVMQVLWLYIDEIAGKGVGFLILMELVGYMSLSVIPLALIIATLLAAVLVIGNLAESYELSSISSAGVSLLRVYLPLTGVVALICLFSFYCSNSLIPIANLQYKSRLYDISHQKATLNLDEGVFNDDFKGFAIYIGEKDDDGRGIKDVLLYDHSNSANNKLTMVSAQSGEMYSKDDGDFFIMNLVDGEQHSEPKMNKQKDDKSEKYPFVRTTFKEYTKVFDLSEFQLERNDTELFKNNQQMLTIAQLDVKIDSINAEISSKIEGFTKQIHKQMHRFKMRDTAHVRRMGNIKTALAKKKAESKINLTAKEMGSKRSSKQRKVKQIITKEVSEYDNMTQTFSKFKLDQVFKNAKASSRTILASAETATKSIKRKRESRVKHIHEQHSKYVLAVTCMIFLFIGSSMGAIVRKGGYGVPLLVAVIFFILFMVFNIMAKNLAERFVLQPVLGTWLTVFIFMPIAMILTLFAMDSNRNLLIFNIWDKIASFVRKTFKKKASEI